MRMSLVDTIIINCYKYLITYLKELAYNQQKSEVGHMKKRIAMLLKIAVLFTSMSIINRLIINNLINNIRAFVSIR